MNKIPVFGILERGGKVKVEVVKDVNAETLLRETIKKVKRGSLIYTDKCDRELKQHVQESYEGQESIFE